MSGAEAQRPGISLMTGRGPEMAAPPAGRPADLAEAHGGP